jgi:hypothetical protein
VDVVGDLGLDHLSFALSNPAHVDGHGTGHGSELRGMAHEMRDLGAPNFVLGGHEVDVGIRTPDPPALHHSRPPA